MADDEKKDLGSLLAAVGLAGVWGYYIGNWTADKLDQLLRSIATVQAQCSNIIRELPRIRSLVRDALQDGPHAQRVNALLDQIEYELNDAADDARNAEDAAEQERRDIERGKSDDDLGVERKADVKTGDAHRLYA